MGYVFNKEGKFEKSDKGEDNIYEAALQRLEDLLRIISDESELEVGYREEDDSWIVYEYFPEREQAIEFRDEKGNPVVAFTGIPYDIMTEILNKSDVWFVG
ncbi:hypothetical protein RASY3_14550 [Ruminococcus albus SY3]|uniref:Uncharacterized protein n=1 Tax=Ruminococcus albus SY3 TaxID=1341156 RepID=A0A011UD61_RUMAL|nr:hypothetical protein [Ruminococcus albus]EXM38539.1 hypothetical protein RASY3_14550 [Ruminococcus albus SY3]